MAKQVINIGTNPNDNTGDSIRDAFDKTNDNFTDLYDNKQSTMTKAAYTDVDTGTDDAKFMTALSLRDSKTAFEIMGFALSDETTALTTGQKIAVYMPFDFTVKRVYCEVVTAPTDANLQIDVEDGGTSILNTVLSIIATQYTAETSTFASSATSYTLHKGDLLTIDIDQIGSTVAGAGAKVFLEGYR